MSARSNSSFRTLIGQPIGLNLGALLGLKMG